MARETNGVSTCAMCGEPLTVDEERCTMCGHHVAEAVEGEASAAPSESNPYESPGGLVLQEGTDAPSIDGDLARQVALLENRLRELEKRAYGTRLTSSSFLARAFTVWGHFFTAHILIAIPLIAFILLWVTVLSLFMAG